MFLCEEEFFAPAVARKLREKSTETGVLNAESFFLRTETLASQALLEVAIRNVLLL